MSASECPAFAFLEPGDPFPVHGTVTEELGPLAVGADLSVSTLKAAYSQGIFPWYSSGPILWWSPHPRMVLQTAQFHLSSSLRKTIARLHQAGRLHIQVDAHFQTVIQRCARTPREGQNGTWIVQDMQNAYYDLHLAGFAHSVETWLDGELAGGLYCVHIGQAVFGESMFSLKSDASKIALAALVALCRKYAMPLIDCQQNTAHLASLGAAEMDRSTFLAHISTLTAQQQTEWAFSPADWHYLHPHILR
ncbi:leucyl/phenylalanyl-tRNA--protein transferase [Lampropedia puyangensis]|uniref:Leucyl/phenylalanyl-tRNA--protein transferase n=1 Tax=Lampropedia puyangensis TaxID=1330072 RepID=A0A4S8F4Y7_9BURK|nr:leucyl/phenylalanyl-tRNA--protein transferase [Lampropedia puyangensis]THU02503.1 leucyl/phenylalanyl-tRNA--protein transferase [Lampropedia puyangensis]